MNIDLLLSLPEEEFLKEAYRLILGRHVDHSGLVNYMNRLLKGDDKASILRELYASKEARAHRTLSNLNGYADETYIDAVYFRLLGRAPDRAGRQHYLSLIKKGKRKKIVPDIKSSGEYKKIHAERIAFEAALIPIIYKQFHIKKLASPARFFKKKNQDEYQSWIAKYEYLRDEEKDSLRKTAGEVGKVGAITVVIAASRGNERYLDESIASIRAQIHPHWQCLVVVDPVMSDGTKNLLLKYVNADKRIQLVYSIVNGGDISSACNAALQQAQGRLTLFLRCEDKLPDMALYSIARATADVPDAGLIYGDEDQIDDAGQRSNPWFKPDYNPQLLLAQHMMGSMCAYGTDLLRRVGGLRPGLSDAVFWDASLRVIEQLTESQIVHIPRVMYHKRAPALAAESNDTARQVVQEHLDRIGVKAQVVAAPELPHCNRVIYARPESQPMVSIIIPTRDKSDLLMRCIDSIRRLSTYRNYEILVIDNGSHEKETLALLQHLAGEGVRVERLDIPFNYATLNNFAASKTQAELLCFLNNDTEILTPDWLEELASFALQKGVGAVGARLWYPDGRLQHGGVISGISGIADHAHSRIVRGVTGYFGRAVLQQNLSAVTGACLMVRRETFAQVSGFDEGFAVSLNDVDLCLRLQQAGYRTVWTPYAELVHHESASRGLDSELRQRPRVALEVMALHSRWGAPLFSDPAYNPNLSLEKADFSLAHPPRVGWLGQPSHHVLALLAKDWFPVLKEAVILAMEPLEQERSRLSKSVRDLIESRSLLEQENEELLHLYLEMQERVVQLLFRTNELEAEAFAQSQRQVRPSNAL